MIYRFNNSEIDTSNYSLVEGGVTVTVEPQVFDLIVYLIESRGRLVSRQEILDTLWAGKVVSDAALSNRIKMARSAVGDNGQSQSVIKTVHGRGYQFVAELKGPAEATISQTDVVDDDTLTQASKRPRRLWLMGAALSALLIAGVYFVAFGEKNDLVRDKSIAVLPFDNSSNQADDLYFTDGIHGDLLAQISSIKDLKSISRTSVMTYRGSNKNLQEIAKELGVGSILEGGVQRSGNQVRINMQLIDAKTDMPIWSVTYTRELTAENLFQIQTEIATAVAVKLKAELSPAEKSRLEGLPTENLAALELYFKAKAETEKATSKGYQKAVGYLKHAIALDQNFANAYVDLANIYLVQTFFEGLPRAKQLMLADEVIQKAKALEGNSSTIITIEAQFIEYSSQFEKAEQYYQRAIALNPNNVAAYVNYGHMLNWIYFDYTQSIQMYEKALRLDPANLGIQLQFAEVLNNAGNAEQSIRVYKNVIAQDPNLPTAWLGLCRTYAESLFQYDQAIAACRQAMMLDPGNPFIPNFIALAYGNIGEPKLMAKFSQRAYDLNPQSQSNLGKKLFAEEKPHAALNAFYKVEKGTIYFRHCNGYVANIGLTYDPQGALEHFTKHYPEFLLEEFEIDAQTIYPAYYFAMLLEKNGDQDNFRKLIHKGLEFISASYTTIALQELPIVIAYHLAADKQKEALEYFSEFVQRGGSMGSNAYVGSMANLFVDFPNGPIRTKSLDTKNSEIINLQMIMNSRLQQQRSNLQSLEASGQLAAVPE